MAISKHTRQATSAALAESYCCVVLDLMRTVTIPVEEIVDFHDTFQRELGFPDFYGRNINGGQGCGVPSHV